MTSVLSFAVTWDYRCPFARNAHEFILDAVEGGATWDITYVPFFLDTSHVAEGISAWESPDNIPNLLSLEAGIVVRDRFPEVFPAVHRSLFAARHDDRGDLRDRSVVAGALERAGADPVAVLAEVDAGWPRKVARTEHEQVVDDHEVFGVPTFILDGQAVFVRLLTRPEGDTAGARATVDRVLALITDHPEINEFKHTKLAR